jgi:hypothetical protein
VFDLVWCADVFDHVDFDEWHFCSFDAVMALESDRFVRRYEATGCFLSILRISMVWSLYILSHSIRGIPLDDACEMGVMVTRIEFVVVSTPIFSVLEMCYYAYTSHI